MGRSLLMILLLINAWNARAQQDSLIRLVDTDLRAFWDHYDQFTKDTTQNPFEAYISNGSPGLVAYTSHWDKAAQYFKRNVRHHYQYFEKRRHSMHNFQDDRSKIHEYFLKFRALYPEAIAPRVYFIGSALTTLCHTSKEGVIIGADVFADSAFQVAGDFRALNYDQVPIRTLQCMISYNSRTAHIGYYLLREAIVEGSAAFITGMVSDEFRNRFTSTRMFKYGETHEEMLVKEFLRRKYDSDFTGWSYWSDGTDRPTGLGAWIGYKITESYYLTATDKQKAIDDILEINDFEKFLSLSGYTQVFSN